VLFEKSSAWDEVSARLQQSCRFQKDQKFQNQKKGICYKEVTRVDAGLVQRQDNVAAMRHISLFVMRAGRRCLITDMFQPLVNPN
jgi:hypothetical protein